MLWLPMFVIVCLVFSGYFVANSNPAVVILLATAGSLLVGVGIGLLLMKERIHRFAIDRVAQLTSSPDRCPRCDYSIKSLLGTRQCPECGLELIDQAPAEILIRNAFPRIPWTYFYGGALAFASALSLAAGFPPTILYGGAAVLLFAVGVLLR